MKRDPAPSWHELVLPGPKANSARAMKARADLAADLVRRTVVEVAHAAPGRASRRHVVVDESSGKTVCIARRRGRLVQHPGRLHPVSIPGQYRAGHLDRARRRQAVSA